MRSARAVLATALVFAGCAEPARCPDPPPPPACPAAAAAPAPAPAPVKQSAAAALAEVVARSNAGDAEALFARFAPEMKQQVPLVAVQAMLRGLIEARGKLGAVTPIAAEQDQGTFTVAAERGAWEVMIALDAEGAIAGLKFSEPSDAPPLARSAPLGLPFRGRWLVVWGGDTPELNHHVEHASQRRALDLVIADDAGQTFRGEGRALADYYAYGQEVLAMDEGVVTTVIDGVPDTPIGETNPYVAPGNLVTLRHEGERYSTYAHLIPGSLKVKVGARVRRGQVLGRCGNSGNSTEPHLHVQVQDGPRFEKSWGVEMVFAEVTLTRSGADERRADHVPMKGDLLAPATRR